MTDHGWAAQLYVWVTLGRTPERMYRPCGDDPSVGIEPDLSNIKMLSHTFPFQAGAPFPNSYTNLSLENVPEDLRPQLRRVRQGDLAM